MNHSAHQESGSFDGLQRQNYGRLRNGIGRNAEFDFTKGVLVLFMVLYHWLNYFISPTGFFYSYLRFVTISFIFVAGFLITNVGYSKYSHNCRQFRGRLAQRGVKLLCIFSVLNLGMWALLAPNRQLLGSSFHPIAFLRGTSEILLFGSEKNAAFQILVPISYILLLASILTFAGCRFNAWIYGCAAMGLLLSFAARPAGNFYCLGSGILGLCIGTIPLNKIEKLLRFPWSLIVINCLYLAVITKGEIPYLFQLAGALVTLLIIYGLAKKLESQQLAYRLVAILGSYSLFAYITQIAILQTLRTLFRHFSPGALPLSLSFFSAFGFTILGVILVDYLRIKAPFTDRMYRFAFT